MLDLTLSIVQWLAATVFTVTGGAKLALSREALAPRMYWAASWPRARIKLLGLAEVAGAAGLVAPRAVAIAPALTPVAAVCLAILMVGAVHTHRRLGERWLPAALIGALCIGIAAGRLALGAHA